MDFWISRMILKHDISVKYSKKYLRFLIENDQRLTIFVQIKQKMHSPKVVFRSKLEPNDYFMVLLNFGMKITLYGWILESPQPIFFRKQKRVKYTILPKHSKLNKCL